MNQPSSSCQLRPNAGPRSSQASWRALPARGVALSVFLGSVLLAAAAVHDLSLLVSPRLPCVWPVGMMQHLVTPNRTFGPGAYHRDLIAIDEHTGTQWDAPAHFVPPPDSGLPGAGPMGLITGEKVPAWQFCGEACVIDVSAHLNNAPPGSSYLIRPEVVQAWEKRYRPLKPGDLVLFRSGYSDRYYQPLPEGRRFVHAALKKETPGWPAPTPETMTYLADKGVLTLGLDSPSMGPLPDLAVATHQAGGQRGMIWTECLRNLGSLPPTGAFHAILAAKHAGGSGGECRAIAIIDYKLAPRLIASARQKRVLDLSVTLDEDLPITWPGREPGDEAPRYLAKTLNPFSKLRGPYFARTHLLDSQAGTHVVPPSFSLPPSGFRKASYSEEIRASLVAYEKTFRLRGTSDMTVEKMPLEVLMGEAHIIDVRSLLGTTSQDRWPASPLITLEFVKNHQKARPILPGEVVIFRSGYSDTHFAPLPEQPKLDRLFAAPLAGQAEGWPSPTAEVVAYLAELGVRCLGTDGPMLGGVDPKQALEVYWVAATRGVFPVEYLINLGSLPESGAYFIFAPIRIEGAHGGYGRALALF